MVKTIGIVSLSSGVLGETFVKHELDLGLERLEAMGLRVKFMDNALRGLKDLDDHPEKRAEDLLQAFRDPELDMILCAIGGDDTYRLLPYLFGRDELKNALGPKIFLGFSDTTINHLMLHKVGLNSFYGQSFLSDVCELGAEMLPYTAQYFRELVSTGGIREIRPSPLWYKCRENYGPDQLGVELMAHPDRGFELLQGPAVFSGRILGGCIDTLFDIFDPGRHPDSPALCRQYGLFPALEDWRDKILLLESSEEKPSPEKYESMLQTLKNSGLFSVIRGLLVGKPMDESYYEEYKQLLVKVIDDPALPILYNLNIGHALPRCIIPFGVEATVDAGEQVIRFTPPSP